MESKRRNKGNYLIEKMPELAKQWHPTKNKDISLNDVTCGSGKKVWWKCSNGHEWQAIIGDRARGNGCPYCAGKIATLENCLATVNPKLAEEWNNKKNKKLTPYDVTNFSNKKVWWKCSNEHEWQAPINNRSAGRGCPYCGNKKVCKDNCLATINSELSKEWDSIRNGDLTPNDVMPGSHKKVWWKCSEGHTWEAGIYDRNRGTGCPYCANQKVCEDNCLSTVNPKLAQEWHPIKNGNLRPTDVTRASNKVVWWKCKNGHEWKVSVNNRNKGAGCPYCANKKVCEDNCLATLHPNLIKEWHAIKNKKLTPYDIVANSEKKVWWKCGKGHEWQTSVYHRVSGKGCPYCANQKVCEDNCLSTINPQLAEEWHPTRNEGLTPNDVVSKSSKKVWWKCSKGHEWQAAISDRNSGKGCPYCANRMVNEDNCLATTNPKLAEEWHPIKNEDLTPNDVVSKSGKKVWWKCNKGHSWEATIASRSSGTGCPYCNGFQTSFPEQTIYYYLKKIFNKVHNRYKYKGVEIDIFIEDINFAIEYDGAQFHSTKEAITKDTNKNEILYNNKINFIRVREKGCPKIDMKGFDYIEYKMKSNYNNIGEIIKIILEKIKKFSIEYSEACIELEKEINIERDRFEILAQYKNYDFSNVNRDRFNELSKEWDYEKNKDLKLENFSTASKEYVWWKCSKEHEWKSIIKIRYDGTGCPYCANQKVCEDNCLATVNPKLAKEWHPTKNGDLTPYDIIPGSKKRIWWKCKKGHEWQAVISSRNNGVECPYCSNKKVCKDNCLATKNPELAKEWHPTKNKDLTPNDVVANSVKKVWWKCNKGHEWQVSVHSRNKGTGCPYCSNQKVCEDNCLATLYPDLVKEWDQSKNGDLTPYDVMPGSGKKVWWKCNEGHEWEARICNRASGSGCHYCTGQKVTKDKSLGSLNKELSKEWNQSKNGHLTPYDVGIGSHKKVWWKCDKGHEWQAKVYARSAGSGCPECYKESRVKK